MALNVVCLFPQGELGAFITFTLEGTVGARVVEVSTAREAVDLINERRIDAVITEESSELEPLLAELKRLEAHAPCVLLTSAPVRTASPLVKHVFSGADAIERLCQSMRTEFLPRARSKEDDWDPRGTRLCRIRSELLVRASPLKADVYIRLSDSKTLKIFSANDVFDGRDLQRYRDEKRVTHFFLQQADCDLFLGKLRASVVEELKTMAAESPRAVEVSRSLHETVQDLVIELGPTKEVQEIVKVNAMAAMKTIRGQARLRDVLKQIQTGSDYHSEHSRLLGIMACFVASAVSWQSDSTYYKLAVAGLMHDVGLRGPRLQSIRSSQASAADLKAGKLKLSPLEQEAYLRHPLLSAEFVRGFKDVPKDVETIILQHEERPDGSGFPRGLRGKQLTPLSTLFIIAHQLVDEILARTSKPSPDSQGALQALSPSLSIDSFVAEQSERYDSPEYRKLLRALLKSEATKL